MLYGYPIEATEANWLHECLCDAIGRIHQHFDAGTPVPDWPGVLAGVHKVDLAERTGLRKRFAEYQRALAGLAQVERDAILTALEEENRISDLVSCACDCPSVSDLPEPVRDPVRNLFEFGFRLLTDLEIRDAHYRVIYERSKRVCPFCGTEYFDAPGAPREALDHYLNKAKYPLAAVNLRNLVPMGTKCNSRYKLAKDILRNEDGTRRRSFDPYNHAGVRLSLEGSEPFGGEREELPNWRIEFDPPCEEVETWNDVFGIRTRYRRDFLDPGYKEWIDDFSRFARRSHPIGADEDDKIISILGQLEWLYGNMDLGVLSFLQAGVFRMLRQECEGGNLRLLAVLKDSIAA